MSLEIISEEPITMAAMRAELAKVKERDGELNFRANKTEEFLGLYSDLEPAKLEELHKKIVELGIPRLKEDHIVKIVDLLPVTVEELKSILQGYTVTVTKDNMAKIVAATKDFVPEIK